MTLSCSLVSSVVVVAAVATHQRLQSWNYNSRLSLRSSSSRQPAAFFNDSLVCGGPFFISIPLDGHSRRSRAHNHHLRANPDLFHFALPCALTCLNPRRAKLPIVQTRPLAATFLFVHKHRTQRPRCRVPCRVALVSLLDFESRSTGARGRAQSELARCQGAIQTR